jgi:hypothetical protein
MVIDPKNVWHIRISGNNREDYYRDTLGETIKVEKIDLFNYILWKRWGHWPYLVHSSDAEPMKIIKKQVCRYCKGRVWLYPVPPQDIGKLKSLAVQLGFSIKIELFCKHTSCLKNRKMAMDIDTKGLSFV